MNQQIQSGTPNFVAFSGNGKRLADGSEATPQNETRSSRSTVVSSEDKKEELQTRRELLATAATRRFGSQNSSAFHSH